MTDLFFVYCPESGFDCFLTLDAALDEANERIQGYLGDAWSEEVTGVCAGKITHRAKMCNQVFPDGEIDEDGFDESGCLWDTDCECKCNYKILQAEQNPAPDVAELVEVLEELIDLMEDVHQGEYTPDSFTTQPARTALTTYRKQGGDL